LKTALERLEGAKSRSSLFSSSGDGAPPWAGDVSEAQKKLWFPVAAGVVRAPRSSAATAVHMRFELQAAQGRFR